MGVVGARTRFQNSSAKKFASLSECATEEGHRRNSAAPERIRRKNPARANQKSQRKLFAGWRASANGGGAASFVGVRLIKGSDFVQETQLIKNRRNAPVFD
jgi:hypothetical protein